jgi:hypothetical protein
LSIKKIEIYLFFSRQNAKNNYEEEFTQRHGGAKSAKGGAK